MEADNEEAYWRRTLFIPYLDELCQQFDARFNKLTKLVVKVLCLLPAHLHNLSSEDERDICSVFSQDGGIPHPENFHQEVRLWRSKWASHSTDKHKPQTLQESTDQCNPISYPDIYYIMRCLLVFSATSAGVERAHSALKCIKTSRRNSMGQDHLVALMLFYVDRAIPVNYGSIIDMYAKANPRRMLLSNPIGNVPK